MYRIHMFQSANGYSFAQLITYLRYILWPMSPDRIHNKALEMKGKKGLCLGITWMGLRLHKACLCRATIQLGKSLFLTKEDTAHALLSFCRGRPTHGCKSFRSA